MSAFTEAINLPHSTFRNAPQPTDTKGVEDQLKMGEDVAMDVSVTVGVGVSVRVRLHVHMGMSVSVRVSVRVRVEG